MLSTISHNYGCEWNTSSGPLLNRAALTCDVGSYAPAGVHQGGLSVQADEEGPSTAHVLPGAWRTLPLITRLSDEKGFTVW